MSADSIHFPDSLKFKTLISQRTVYGGGGIMPDIFVPADTSHYSDYYRNLVRRGVLNSFALEYSDGNRDKLSAEYKTFADFRKKFSFTTDEIASFIRKAEEAGVKYNDEQFQKSKEEILIVLKGLLASNRWQTNAYYQIINENDKVIEKALEAVSDDSVYNRVLGR